MALGFLAVTGGLLIWDLKHPLRFYLIFTRHHWLVRGSFIIGAYGAWQRCTSWPGCSPASMPTWRPALVGAAGRALCPHSAAAANLACRGWLRWARSLPSLALTLTCPACDGTCAVNSARTAPRICSAVSGTGITAAGVPAHFRAASAPGLPGHPQAGLDDAIAGEPFGSLLAGDRPACCPAARPVQWELLCARIRASPGDWPGPASTR